MHQFHKFILAWNSTRFGQFLCPKRVEFHAINKICEISASGWFYYKEICYEARSHERYNLSMHIY